MVVELFEMNMSPWCRSIKVLAKLIGVELKLTAVDMMGKKQLEPDFVEMNPFHTIPTIKDGDFCLFESRAIMAYLVSKYAPDSDLYPKDLQQRALVDAMLYYDNGTLAQCLIQRVHHIMETGEDSEAKIEKCKDCYKCLNSVLANRKYVAGDRLSLADIALANTMSTTRSLEEDLTEYPHLSEYMNRLQEDLGEYYVQITDEAIKPFIAFIKEKKKK